MSAIIPGAIIAALVAALAIGKSKKGKVGDTFPNQSGEVQDAIDKAIAEGDVTALEVLANLIEDDDPEGAKRLRDIAEKIEGGKPPELNPQLIQRIVKAVESQDPAKMRALATELELLGFKKQADSLRAEADKVAKGDTVIKDEPVQVTPELAAPKPAVKPLPLDANPLYVVVDGDSAIKITRKFLGTGVDSRYKELLAANPQKKQVKDKNKNPNFATLFAGEKLNIPKNWPTKPGAVSVSAPAPSKPADVPSGASLGGTYTVLTGDFPIKITRKFLGPGKDARYKELLKANPQKKLNADKSNFLFLAAGEKLILPSDWPSTPQF